jgi:hypothetical protein
MLTLIFLHKNTYAQCPAVTVLPGNAEMVFDDFSEYTSGITRFGITTVGVDLGACPALNWDFWAQAEIIQGVTYSMLGVPLSLSSVNIRAVNSCATPDVGGVGPNRITGAFSNNLSPALTDKYIIGTIAADGNIPSASCGGNINLGGSPVTSSTKNSFRIDLKIKPGLTGPIQPGIYDLNIVFYTANDANHASPDAHPFSLQIEIKPVLELKMTGSSQINFQFDNISDYTSGKTIYGATLLNVNSTVSWDLIAVGTSTLNQNTAGASPYWDQNIGYSTTGNMLIPLRALEVHQTPGNPAGSGAATDYSSAFATPPSGNNYINTAYETGGTTSTFNNLAIAGKVGLTGAANSVIPGSYINTIGEAFNSSNYKYSIDYRLFPGLPPTFNGLMGSSVQPGTYTMEIRYIITEDQ